MHKLPTDVDELRRFAEGSIRKPVVAGRFYPAPSKVLRRAVEGYLRDSGVDPRGGIRALISPHAGYPYSGPVAGAAYAAVERGGYDRVVVIAPSHQHPFEGVSAYIGEAYETPLGRVRIDLEALAALAGELDTLGFHPEAHRFEHALEVQLPFIQVALGDVALVPLVMGDQRASTVQKLGKALAAAFPDDNTLVVASSDLSHYHEDSVARVLDGVLISHVRSFEPEELMDSIEAGRTAACGGGAVAAAMVYARKVGADVSRVLAYATSGDTSGDRSHVVGYLAAVMHGPQGRPNAHELDRLERRELLSLARRSLEAHYEGQEPPELTNPSRRLRQKRGAFVTLTKRGNLRGCIGYIHVERPLWLVVREMAVAAATGDPRFAPVHAAELGDLHIEISVLSPVEPLEDPAAVVVGRHGLIVRRGGRSGLLLPQVPVEQGWNREEFLDHTCRKAGLEPGCWRSGAELFVFSAQVFGE